MIKKSDFYNSHSGESYYVSIQDRAKNDAQSISSFFYGLAISYGAKQAKPELEHFRDELESNIAQLREQIGELDAKLENKKERNRDALQAERNQAGASLTRERAALEQVNLALRGLNTVKIPVAPPWLVDWISDKK